MIMKVFTFAILYFLASFVTIAQINVTGKIIDKENNEPLVGASVIVKGADGKIKKFSSSKADGGFSMTMPSVNGCRLEVTMMSFASSLFHLTAWIFR